MEGAILCHKNGNCLCCKPGHHRWYSNQNMDWTLWGSITITSKKNFFSLLQNVQTGSEAHPASYSMGISISILGCKAAGAQT